MESTGGDDSLKHKVRETISLEKDVIRLQAVDCRAVWHRFIGQVLSLARGLREDPQ